MRIVWFLLQLIYVSWFKPNGSKCENKEFVAGGKLYNPIDFPYVVGLRIQMNRYHESICTGTLISPLIVLTAAHCTYERTARQLKVFIAHSIMISHT